MLIVCSDLCCSGQALHQQRQFAVLLAYFLWCIRFKCALCAAIWCESYIHLLPSAATQPNPWKTEKASKGKAMVGRSVGWWAVGVGWWDEWLCLLLLFVCCVPVSLIRIDILSPSPVPPPFSLSLFNFSLWFSLVFVGEQTSHTHTNATRWTSTSTTPTQFLRCRSSSRFAPRFRSPVSMRDPNEHRLFPIISYALVALFHSHTRTHTHSLTHSHSLTHTHTHTLTHTHTHLHPLSPLPRLLHSLVLCAGQVQGSSVHAHAKRQGKVPPRHGRHHRHHRRRCCWRLHDGHRHRQGPPLVSTLSSRPNHAHAHMHVMLWRRL